MLPELCCGSWGHATAPASPPAARRLLSACFLRRHRAVKLQLQPKISPKPEFLICKSLETILAFYCFPINKMQEIVLNASPLELPIIYHIKCPFFQAFWFTPANRLCKHVLQFSIWNRTDPNSVQSNAKCLHVLLLQNVSSRRRQCTELYYELRV